MKYMEAIIAVSLFFMFSLCSSGFINTISKINRQCLQLQTEVSAESFISNSFVNTCKGKGYKDLNEWQSECRKIYGLDYIAWCNAEDFMDVSYEKQDDALFYGIWKSELTNGEVYCRKN